MSNKVIALDLVGVITDISKQLVQYAEDKDIKITAKSVAKALLTPCGDENLEHLFYNKAFWDDLLPIKESWHIVNEWFMSGYDVFFITARRSENSINAIDGWLDKWSVMYSDVIVCDMYDKFNFINKIQPTFYVDDNPYEVNKVRAMTSAPSYVFKTWYNSYLIGSLNSINSLSELKIG